VVTRPQGPAISTVGSPITGVGEFGGWCHATNPYGLVDMNLVGRASLDLATLGLKVSAGRFHCSSAFAIGGRRLL
jgi:hypothetical protein